MRLDPTHCLIIGEVAQAHDGSLGTAHAYIDAIAKTGANAVKFQTHIAAAESTPIETWRVRFSFQDASRYDYWKRMEFTEEQWLGLKRHADDKGLEFLSSPFSVQAAEMLTRIGVRAWKVASGEMTNSQLFDYLLGTRLPILLSSGMNTIEEVDVAVARIQAAGLPLAVSQCTSMYPCPAEKVGLNMIPFYRQRYGCCGRASPTIRERFMQARRGGAGNRSSGSTCSVQPRMLRAGRGGIADDGRDGGSWWRECDSLNGCRTHAVDKDEMAVEMAPVRNLFTKSIVAQIDLPADTMLTAECLAVKKPGTGMPAEKLPSMIGGQAASSPGCGRYFE